MIVTKQNMLALFVIIGLGITGFLIAKDHYIQIGINEGIEQSTQQIEKIQKEINSLKEKNRLLEEENKEARMISHIAKTYKKPREKIENIWREVQNHTGEKDIDPVLVMALIATESSFNQKAVSYAGAIGLTQVIPYWHKEKIKNGDLTNHKVSVRVGVDVLDEYLDWEDGNLRLALQRYNGNKKDKTQRYANKVLNTQEKLLEYMETPINS